MNQPNENSTSRIVLIFGLAVAALFMFIMASMVDMPLRAILIALAVSDVIFLGIVTLGNKLPGGKQ